MQLLRTEHSSENQKALCVFSVQSLVSAQTALVADGQPVESLQWLLISLCDSMNNNFMQIS